MSIAYIPFPLVILQCRLRVGSTRVAPVRGHGYEILSSMLETILIREIVG